MISILTCINSATQAVKFNHDFLHANICTCTQKVGLAMHDYIICRDTENSYITWLQCSWVAKQQTLIDEN